MDGGAGSRSGIGRDDGFNTEGAEVTEVHRRRTEERGGRIACLPRSVVALGSMRELRRHSIAVKAGGSGAEDDAAGQRGKLEGKLALGGRGEG